MYAHTTPPPPIDVVKTATLRLAPLLIRQGLNITISREGTVEVRNPRDSRMRQFLVLREHQGALVWHWVWSGPSRDAPPELEPMVAADDVEEAARRIITVLSIVEPTGAEQ
ncbi:hypothetical protein NE236_30620 [Actinoallomurus purpureus]|uniref:hypothetical protein n=1 Tax=Actinoallomurus purpureus TaxID=478114 RepID=UPI0020927775|nr:hypothetical protein [Actinoallomurus purpureus]MCO6009334.1 hypothetical protein [Actinoallomurus purpureus]